MDHRTHDRAFGTFAVLIFGNLQELIINYIPFTDKDRKRQLVAVARAAALSDELPQTS